MMEVNKNSTYIGLDVGERRIGVARIHGIAGIAEPLDQIEVSKQDVDDAIKKVILDYQADGLVVGLPRGLDGQETAQTKYCIDFAHKIKKEVAIPVYMIDEAGTSKAADERLTINSAISRDSMAAAILLEDFLAYKVKDELEI